MMIISVSTTVLLTPPHVCERFLPSECRPYLTVAALTSVRQRYTYVEIRP